MYHGPRGVPWPSRGVPWPLYEEYGLESAYYLYSRARLITLGALRTSQRGFFCVTALSPSLVPTPPANLSFQRPTLFLQCFGYYEQTHFIISTTEFFAARPGPPSSLEPYVRAYHAYWLFQPWETVTRPTQAAAEYFLETTDGQVTVYKFYAMEVEVWLEVVEFICQALERLEKLEILESTWVSSRKSLNLVFLSRTTWRERVPEKPFTLWIVH